MFQSTYTESEIYVFNCKRSNYICIVLTNSVHVVKPDIIYTDAFRSFYYDFEMRFDRLILFYTYYMYLCKYHRAILFVCLSVCVFVLTLAEQ